MSLWRCGALWRLWLDSISEARGSSSFVSLSSPSHKLHASHPSPSASQQAAQPPPLQPACSPFSPSCLVSAGCCLTLSLFPGFFPFFLLFYGGLSSEAYRALLAGCSFPPHTLRKSVWKSIKPLCNRKEFDPSVPAKSSECNRQALPFSNFSGPKKENPTKAGPQTVQKERACSTTTLC
jgi:hypothetical protein